MALSESVFIGRQPILNQDETVYAYEILYRADSNNAAGVSDDLLATSQVLINALIHFGVEKILGAYKGFINTNETIIFSNILSQLNPKKFVIEILETTQVTPELVEKIIEMKAKGFTFALDDFVFSNEMLKYFAPLFPHMSYLKVDLMENDFESLRGKLNLVQKYDMKLLAEKVETRADFSESINLGFTLFQGYFFSKPDVLTTKSIEPERLAVLELVGMMQNDPETDEIEKILRKYPQLTINLLKLINSAAIGARSQITSVRQAIALLGQKQLQHWLLLMLYAGTSSHGHSALFESASFRARSMESLVKKIDKNNRQIVDEAFLVGLLSLMGTLLGESLEKLLDDLNMAPEIRSAILERKGLLGELLTLVEKSELEYAQDLNVHLERLNLNLGDFSQTALESYGWVNEVQGGGF